MIKRRFPKCHCGWPWANFHICVDLETPEPELPEPVKRKNNNGKNLNRKSRAKAVDNRRGPKPKSEAHIEAIREAAVARAARLRAKNYERDRAIVERYNQGGIGTVALAKMYNVGPGAITGVLKRAEAEGLTTVRQRGANVRWES